MEYVIPLCPHCPADGPLMAAGTPGEFEPTPFERTPLAYPHALIAVTLTVDPAGIDAGKVIEHEVPEGTTLAPTTDVVQL